MDAAVEGVRAHAYTIPTDLPEANGTASWTSTTIVVVQVQAAGRCSLGYTYSDASVASLINEKLTPVVIGREVMDPPSAWRGMNVAIRNLGREGLCATAISALDTALWDLKAVVLDQPLAALLGRYRNAVPIYGSGGFTSYDDRRLARQLAGWVEKDGCHWVKMRFSRTLDTAGEMRPTKVVGR